MDMADLPERLAEFAFPGELRERLVGAILVGEKTATAGLLLEYELEAESLPEPGERQTVIDSAGRPVAVIEIVAVDVVPFAEVGFAFARDEGEGFTTADDWRAVHRRFWESDEMRAALGRPDFAIADDTLVVAERFRLVETL
jgi:uncharacterized protein YhfF